jgi:hypothetical protein
MNTTPRPDTDPLALGRRIVDILESGEKTSTYKLAVLRALIDCFMNRVPDDQHASVDVPLNELTDRVIGPSVVTRRILTLRSLVRYAALRAPEDADRISRVLADNREPTGV